MPSSPHSCAKLGASGTFFYCSKKSEKKAGFSLPPQERAAGVVALSIQCSLVYFFATSKT